MDMGNFAKLSPMEAWLSMTGAAASWFFYSAFEAFRYRSDSNYYAYAKIGDDTEWYKLSSQISHYSGVAIGGMLTVAGLLSAFGIATNTLGLAWMYLVIGSWVVNLAIDIIRTLGYDAAYTHATGTDAVKAASGIAVMAAIKTDSIIDVLSRSAMAAATYGA